ncbi:TonB-dependent siderophore receptor, partial [bacterium]|nr:TonB-dependent siderophore receptor [bacterium]
MSPGRNSRLRTVGLLTLGLVGTGQVICAKDGTFLPPILPEVVVTGNYPTSPKDTYYSDQLSLKKYTRPQVDTPQSVTSVPRQLMDDTNASTMREVLKNVPGISLAAGEGGAQGDNLTIRGFTARNDIFLDGIRDFGSYYRDSFNWENVEVLKGPASVSFGRGSTGGVVNQVSKAPVKGAHLTGEETVGTAGKQRATLDVNEPLTNNAAIRLNVMAESSKVADRDIVESRRYGIAPSLALGMGTGTRMTLSYFYQQSDDIPDYGIPYLFNAPAPVSRHNFYGFKSDFLNTRANVVTIKAEHDLNDVTMLTNQFRYGHYTRKMRATEARIAGSPTIETPLDSITINRNEINTDSTETAFFNQFDSVSQFKTGDIEHTLVMGAEIAKETSNPTRYTIAGVPTTGLANPDESQSFSGTNTARTITDVISNSLGFYGIDTIKLFEQWEFTGGARWDQFNTVYSQNAASPSSFSATDRFTSWRGAVTY